jgi:PKD repeat protein
LFATNSADSLNSTPVSLTVVPLPATNLAVNVQFVGTSFGSLFADTQTGPAVIGNGGDMWNPVSNPNPVAGDTNAISGSIQGLADAANIGTSISLAYTGNTILNSGVNTPFNGSSSPAANLMEACLGIINTNTATVTVQGLQAGTYDLYLYSSAGNALQAEVSTFTANGAIATVGPNNTNNVLTLGTNYIHLTPTVTPGGLLNISFVGKVNGQASLNGLQLYGPGAVPLPPTAGFTGTPTNTFVAQPVVFTDASTGNITNWLWNFGDGNTVTNGSNANVTHAYAAAGTFTVSLKVTGPNGSATNTQINYIVVNPVPTFGNPVLSGGNLILRGTGGTAGVQYRILTSTNVALPVASWNPVWTNVFAPDGSYSYTNSSLINTVNFFRLISP